MQITTLSVVTEAASEAAYLYAELAHMGADMRYIDCGGGLGIDYDGTASEAHFSQPFSMQVRSEHACLLAYSIRCVHATAVSMGKFCMDIPFVALCGCLLRCVKALYRLQDGACCVLQLHAWF